MEFLHGKMVSATKAIGKTVSNMGMGLSLSPTENTRVDSG